VVLYHFYKALQRASAGRFWQINKNRSKTTKSKQPETEIKYFKINP